MSAIITLPQATSLTMSSREIAELTGKRHDNVRRTIETLVERGVIASPQIEEKADTGGRPAMEYHVGKRDSYVIVAQLSPEFPARLVDRWQMLEAQATHPAFHIPTTLSGALMLAAQQAQQIEQQQAQLAHATPKVEFFDSYADATGLKGFREVAKLLKANEREFRDYLIDSGILYRLGGALTAKQSHIDAGRFDVKTGTSEATGHSYNRTMFTPKGVEWIAKQWAAHELRGATSRGEV